MGMRKTDLNYGDHIMIEDQMAGRTDAYVIATDEYPRVLREANWTLSKNQVVVFYRARNTNRNNPAWYRTTVTLKQCIHEFNANDAAQLAEEVRRGNEQEAEITARANARVNLAEARKDGLAKLERVLELLDLKMAAKPTDSYALTRDNATFNLNVDDAEKLARLLRVALQHQEDRS